MRKKFLKIIQVLCSRLLLLSEESHIAWVDRQTVKRIIGEAVKRIKHIESRLVHLPSSLFSSDRYVIPTWSGWIEARAEEQKKNEFLFLSGPARSSRRLLIITHHY